MAPHDNHQPHEEAASNSVHFAAAASTSDHARGWSGRRRYRVWQARSPDPVRGEVEAQCGGFGRSVLRGDEAVGTLVTWSLQTAERGRESTLFDLAHSVFGVVQTDCAQ